MLLFRTSPHPLGQAPSQVQIKWKGPNDEFSPCDLAGRLCPHLGRLHPKLVPRPTRGPFQDDLRPSTGRISPTSD